MNTYQLPPGTVVGERYRLDHTLGEGGYGITYYGEDLRLELPVAVKEFYPSFWVSRSCSPEAEPEERRVFCRREYEADFRKGLTRFWQEARTLAHLHRIPEIVLVRDYFEENNTAYLVMEYLDGKNLKQMTQGFGGRIPPEVLIPLMEQVLVAMEKVHGKGLIHRDLSPDNIMMLDNGSVRILDFGNARDTTDNRSMTLAMKQGFAPPEQYRSRGQGTWTDVYGICATMYYCMSGKLPTQAMDRLTGKEFPTLTQLGVQLPEAQEEAILQGLDLYVNQRPQTMRELWEKMYGRYGRAWERASMGMEQDWQPAKVCSEYRGSSPLERRSEYQGSDSLQESRSEYRGSSPLEERSEYQGSDSLQESRSEYRGSSPLESRSEYRGSSSRESHSEYHGDSPQESRSEYRSGSSLGGYSEYRGSSPQETRSEYRDGSNSLGSNSEYGKEQRPAGTGSEYWRNGNFAESDSEYGQSTGYGREEGIFSWRQNTPEEELPHTPGGAMGFREICIAIFRKLKDLSGTE